MQNHWLNPGGDRCRRNPLVGTLLLLSLAACADDPVTREPGPGPQTLALTPVQRLDLPTRRAPATRPAATVARPGTDAFLGQRSAVPRSAGPLAQATTGGEVALNLVGVGIPEAAKAVLGDVMGLTYLIQPGVEGQITLQTSTPLARAALLEAFQTALEFNGATLTETRGLVTIAPIGAAAPQFVTVGDTRGLGRRIVLVPLKYISTSEMVRLIEPIVPADAILRVSAERNLMMVSGSQAEIDAILDAVNLFDVDVLQGKSVALIRLRAASPEAVAEELRVIFDTGSGGSLEGVVEFIGNERLGSVLVITSRARYLQEARRWIQELDATAGQSERFPQVYALQNRTAEDLAPVLVDLLAPENDAQQPADAPADILTPVPGAPRIVADPIQNAIIVQGTGAEQEEIARLIAELDTTPAQVLLEAIIAEVTLTDELNFGVRWFFESGNFGVDFTDLASGGVVSSFPGFSFLFDAGGSRLVINALAGITDVKVVSSPSILVLDNREAELNVGDQVPVATQSVVDVTNPDAPIVNSIDFRDTGVILTVKPRVAETGRIIMDIELEVSDVVETTTSGIDSPTIAQRRIRTSVVVDSGQTLALGGLIEDSDNLQRTQVPILGDIPVLGQLFRNKESSIDRSELLILITPRVIRDSGEGQRITQEFRQRLSAPDSLLGGAVRPPRHQIQRLLN